MTLTGTPEEFAALAKSAQTKVVNFTQSTARSNGDGNNVVEKDREIRHIEGLVSE